VSASSRFTLHTIDGGQPQDQATDTPAPRLRRCVHSKRRQSQPGILSRASRLLRVLPTGRSSQLRQSWSAMLCRCIWCPRARKRVASGAPTSTCSPPTSHYMINCAHPAAAL